MPYILEVEEIIVALNENQEASNMKKVNKSFEDYVLNLLHEHYYSLGNDGGKNHQPFHSLKSKDGL